MALADFEYRDPADVVYLRQLWTIKRQHGCAACELRDKSIQVGSKAICSLPSNYPGKQGWCFKWQHDEEVGHAS